MWLSVSADTLAVVTSLGQMAYDIQKHTAEPVYPADGHCLSGQLIHNDPHQPLCTTVLVFYGVERLLAPLHNNYYSLHSCLSTGWHT